MKSVENKTNYFPRKPSISPGQISRIVFLFCVSCVCSATQVDAMFNILGIAEGFMVGLLLSSQCCIRFVTMPPSICG